MNRSMNWVGALILSVSWVVSGCAADDVRVERGCVTQCDVFFRQCQESAARLCDTCLNAVWDIGGDCRSACSSDRCRPCTGGGACVERPWRVSANHEDTSVRMACDLARSQLGTCGMRDALTDCAKASRYERPEAIPVYRCIEQTPCGQSTAHCSAMLPTGTLGTELQAKATSCGWTGWTPEQVQGINAWEGWLRSSASSALRDCIAQSACSDAAECVQAYWRDAL